MIKSCFQKSYWASMAGAVGLLLISGIMALGFWSHRHSDFSLLLTAEAPINVGGKIEVCFDDKDSVCLSQDVLAAKFRQPVYRFENVPAAFDLIRIKLGKYAGADFRIFGLQITPQKAPQTLLFSQNDADFDGWTKFDLTSSGTPGQFRSNAVSPVLQLSRKMDLSALAQSSGIHSSRLRRLVLAALFAGLTILSSAAIAYGLINRRSFANRVAVERQDGPEISRMFHAVLSFALLAVTLAAIELASRPLLSSQFPNLAKYRKLYAGEVTDGEDRPKYTGETYLNYMATPGYRSDGFLQHNLDGYRGERLSLERIPNTRRVLFLGGSVTYDMLVKDPSQTYPADVGKILTERKLEHGGALQTVEVINGGMDFATSAEILTHYIFKYRYYRPDVVVVQSGLNDALSAGYDLYEPDYSHWRRPVPRFDAYAPVTRWTMKSHALALMLLSLTNYGHTDNDDFIHTRGPDAAFFTPSKLLEFELRTTAFKNNISALIREAKADGAEVVLVAEVAAPFIGINSSWEIPFHQANKRHLAELSEKLGTGYVPLTFEMIHRGRYLDGVHLDEVGSYEKAEYVAPEVERRLFARK